MVGKPSSDSQAERGQAGVTALSIACFKSIFDECRLEVRPLTILCGANSSGKSSAMQPFLLLKQTLEATYDPGPLLLNGPNVRFSKAEEMVPRARGRSPAACFRMTLEAWGAQALSLGFGTRPGEGLSLDWMGYAAGGETAVLRPGMSHQQALSAVRKVWGGVLGGLDGTRARKPKWCIARSRCFLEIVVSGGIPPVLVEMPPSTIKFHPPFEQLLRSIIHVPALRGNPERTYKTTAVGPTFPGIFQEYPASIVFHWQTTRDSRLAELGEHLARLGLTWVVYAQPVDETQLELRVGRLPKRSRDGRRDLVSIADVGFGVSQALPVVVALLTASPGQLVYIEQPDIHLHPRAQTELAGLLAGAALRGVRVVVETHSSVLLLAVQTLVAERKLTPDVVKLHWFESDKDGATKVTSRDLDRAGAFGDWPEDFGDVELEAQSRYLDAADRRRAGSSMAAPGRVRLVIDASVARSAGGEEATYPTAQNCRDFLKAVRRICHTMVCTGAIRMEWDRHDSSFSRAWRVWMSGRDKLPEISKTTQKGLRRRIKSVGLTDPQWKAVLKDVPLIEAALATDHVVVSCDSTARNCFHHLVTRVPELGSVAWVNPTHDPDGILRWVEEGAKPESRFLLSS